MNVIHSESFATGRLVVGSSRCAQMHRFPSRRLTVYSRFPLGDHQGRSSPSALTAIQFFFIGCLPIAIGGYPEWIVLHCRRVKRNPTLIRRQFRSMNIPVWEMRSGQSAAESPDPKVRSGSDCRTSRRSFCRQGSSHRFGRRIYPEAEQGASLPRHLSVSCRCYPERHCRPLWTRLETFPKSDGAE